MQGAREYAKLFKTGLYGRLYIVSGSHARGKTFRIFVLPKNENAISNGENNAPLNGDAVEVYGIVGGNPGWTEEYGWLHEGRWQEDFYGLVHAKKVELKREEMLLDEYQEAKEKQHQKRIKALLDTY